MRKKTKIFIASAFAVLAMAGVGTGIYYATRTDKPSVEDNIPVDPGVTPPDDGGGEQPLVHSMTFKVGDETLPSVNVATGGLITPPDDPTKEGYIFAGWALEGSESPVDFSTLAATENMTFVALFEEITYQVTFSVDGKETTQQVAYQGLAVAPTDPVKEGYIFTGWALEGTTEIVDLTVTHINENTTFVAIWINEPVKVTSASKFTFSGNILTGYVGEDTDVVIPASYSLDSEGNPIDGEDFQVTSINPNTFYGNKNIMSVVIPDSVTRIGWTCFRSCTSLKSVKLPSYLTTIETNLFCDCSALESVVVGDSVVTIESQAFSGCAFESISLPDGLITIGENAFSDCKNLTDITIPDSVLYINDGAFDRCSNLKCTIYDNAKYIGSLQNPYMVLISATSTTITSCIVNENCIYIEGSAFNGCKTLTSINLNNVKVVSHHAFNDCISLTSVTIPESVTYIGSSGFTNCKIVVVEGLTPADAQSFAFNSAEAIYVSDDVAETYKSAWSMWSDQIKPVSEYVA